MVKFQFYWFEVFRAFEIFKVVDLAQDLILRLSMVGELYWRASNTAPVLEWDFYSVVLQRLKVNFIKSTGDTFCSKIFLSQTFFILLFVIFVYSVQIKPIFCYNTFEEIALRIQKAVDDHNKIGPLGNGHFHNNAGLSLETNSILFHMMKDSPIKWFLETKRLLCSTAIHFSSFRFFAKCVSQPQLLQSLYLELVMIFRNDV